MKVIDDIKKKFGEGSIMTLDGNNLQDIEVISSGSIALDKALGVGGFPKGRIVEIFGNESGGKTSVCLHTIVEAQKLGLTCAFIDMEHALDPLYASSLGVNLKKLYISQPDNGEQALEIAEALIGSGEVGVVVIDSVAALVPKAEIEGNMGDSVSYDMPIYLKDNNDMIDIIPISKLPNHLSIKQKTLTHLGWKEILGFVVKKNTNNKKIIITYTGDGETKTTEDHCLFINGQEFASKEVNIGDYLDIKNPLFIEYYNKIDMNVVQDVDDDISWFMGAILGAEGHLYDGQFVCLLNHDIASECKRICKTLGYDMKFIFKRKYNSGVFISFPIELVAKLNNISKHDHMNDKRVPKIILNSCTEKYMYLEGFFAGAINGTIGMSNVINAGIQFLCKSLNREYVSDAFRTVNILKKDKKLFENIEENLIYDQHEEYGVKHDYLYDIETESGTFVNAYGNVVVHNSHMGLQARLMSQALRKINPKVKKNNVLLIMVNQTRMKIGVVFGNPETTCVTPDTMVEIIVE